MCVMSMIMDHKLYEWDRISRLPDVVPGPPRITVAEVEEFQRLLERARQYDIDNDEPDCELDEKRQALRTLAKQLGVEIDFL